MPIYEYECTSCGHNFEMVLPFADSLTEIQCPECKKNAKKVPSLFGISFKGKGFYKTDNKKDGEDV